MLPNVEASVAPFVRCNVTILLDDISCQYIARKLQTGLSLAGQITCGALPSPSPFSRNPCAPRSHLAHSSSGPPPPPPPLPARSSTSTLAGPTIPPFPPPPRSPGVRPRLTHQCSSAP